MGVQLDSKEDMVALVRSLMEMRKILQNSIIMTDEALNNNHTITGFHILESYQTVEEGVVYGSLKWVEDVNDTFLDQDFRAEIEDSENDVQPLEYEAITSKQVERKNPSSSTQVTISN